MNDEENIQTEALQIITTEYVPDLITGSGGLYIDITGFLALIHSIYTSIDRRAKAALIQKLLSAHEWTEHHCDKQTGCKVLTEGFIEHTHELVTAKKLAQKNYTVLFAPSGMFKRNEKKFDVFLIKGSIILKADLKAITSKNTDTIDKRIKGGSEQAPRVIIDITSNIDRLTLIDGLRKGVERNNQLIEIILFYKGGFYILPKNRILSKNIYGIIK